MGSLTSKPKAPTIVYNMPASPPAPVDTTPTTTEPDPEVTADEMRVNNILKRSQEKRGK